jgi:TolB-like protein
MKHLHKKMGFLPFLVIVLAGCGSSPTKTEAVSVQGISVDMAIQQAARNIENNIEAGQKVVVLNFSSSSDDFSEYVLGELSTELVNGRKLQVVDRRNLEAIRAEMDFQMSGEVSDESAQAIGRKLGAEYIISGSLTNTGGIYRFRINTINVESAGIAASSATDIANDGKVQALLASGGGSAGTQTARRGNTGGSGSTPAGAESPAQATPAALPPAPVYKVGDTGPAGGIVFYDKGNNSGGWRYLEAAPANTERAAPHLGIGMYDRRFNGSRRLGDGKENTNKFIIEFQRSGGGINTAPWLCNELVVNGFDDWYLPTTDELLYMYNNLYMQGLGDLTNSIYWSSHVYDGTWEYIKCVDFANGSEINESSESAGGKKNQVRAVRQF